MFIFSLCLVALITSPYFTFAGEPSEDIPLTYKETIEVTGRIPSSEDNIQRAITVISREEIDQLPVSGLTDLLTYAAGVDIQRRGVGDIQADISIRGASFEQTLVMIDGIPMNSSQTGHHSLDVPVSLQDIERIEILNGHGPGSFGPAAYQGAINFITRDPGKTGIVFTGELGECSSASGGLSLTWSGNDLDLFLNGQRSISGGYRDNTEHDTNRLMLKMISRTGLGQLELLGGYSDKEFGAYKFYSDTYPDQWESTGSRWGALSLVSEVETLWGVIEVKPIASFHRHLDDFVLDRNRPDWYRNIHETDQFSGEIHTAIQMETMQLATGLNWTRDIIRSDSLGHHNQTQMGFYLEGSLSNSRPVKLSGGLALYHFDDYGCELSPSLDFGFEMTRKLDWFVSVGRSYRLPTFTELHYISPANVGNPDLDPEGVVSMETGLKWHYPGLHLSMAGFYRHGTDQIDWVRKNSDDPWQVMNISEVDVMGSEFKLLILPEHYFSWVPLERVNLSYTYLDTDYSVTDLESKYIAAYLEHQAQLQASHRLFRGLACHWTLRYENRVDSEDLFLGDLRISMDMSNWQVWLNINNLTDKSYDSVTGVPMPGRMWSIGVRATI